MTYQEFLDAKVRTAPRSGFDVECSALNPDLKPFTQDTVRWAVAGGCRAIFSSFGLHKTATQLEIMRQIGMQRSCHRLIVHPLGVRSVFRDEVRDRFQGDYGIDLRFVQGDSEIEGPGPVYHTNYESVREGKIDLKRFGALSLDEGDVLRSFGSKTFGEFLFGDAMQVPMRFVATATPDPNDYIELLSYAQFLGVMDIGESKTRWFKRDSEKADNLTLLAHKEEEFWMWVASWALFLQRPSDLGYSDDGYVQPELEVRWHEIPTDHRRAGQTKRGQNLLIHQTSMGVSDAAREKRESLDARLEKLSEIIAEDPDAHRLIWHDLEAERKGIEQQVPGVVSVYGTQGLDEREQAIDQFTTGQLRYLAAKPSMLGGGMNFQYHCHRAAFLGIGPKFRDFIQAIHRLKRFGQQHRVTIDLIYTEAERAERERLEAKWKRYDEQCERMARILKQFGLSQVAMASALQRQMGCERRESADKSWKLVNNDSVLECESMADQSVDHILSSIPFSSQYEYSPSFNDFGHTDGSEHFFEQMDYLIPNLFRILKPGRVCAIHVKDRAVPGQIIGESYMTVDPFHAHCILHFKRHGFTYGGMITIVTDVVRENNQTNRLGWTEQCKDGSRMSVGIPEYVLLFRRPPTDKSNGYADAPVTKSKEDYTRPRWQFDAHSLWRSSGDRLLTPEEIVGLPMKQQFRTFRKHSAESVYDHERDVAIAEAIDTHDRLPHDFMLLQPVSSHPDVWTDVMRARTLNQRQAHHGREKHICPLQIDVVERLIRRFSNPGEVVFDPFSGIGTVPALAVRHKRFGLGCELNPGYHESAIANCKTEAEGALTPSMFDLIDIEVEGFEEVPA